MNDQIIVKTDEKKKFFQYPWRYKESFTISIGLVVLGFFIELMTGGAGITMPAWPANLLLLLLFVVYVILFHRMVKHPIKKWFSSVPAAIAAISLLTFLVLLMGFIPQGDAMNGKFIGKLGLTHVASSWPYLLCSVNLLFVLGFTIVRRFLPFSLKNVAFTLNHLGLMVVLVASSLGTTDQQKLNMVLTQGKLVYNAADEQQQSYDLDFGLKLTKFNIDEFLPNIGLMDLHTGKMANEHESMLEVKTGNIARLGNWNVEVKEFIESAQRDSNGYVATTMFGGAPAALLSARNLQTNEVKTGWLTSGSPYIFTKFFNLDKDQALAMTARQPKKYSSDITAFYDMNKTEDFTLEVNKPANINGWSLYQSGYDEDMGKWSTTSIVQLVRDPWLPAVYVGIFMIMAGALYLFWMGRSKF